MQKLKKSISLLLSMMIIISVLSGVDLLAQAADIHDVSVSNVKTVFKIHNITYNGTVTTNLGGISAGTANNRVFAVKSSSNQTVATFYYYDNIYDTAYAKETKTPLRIVFPNSFLAHANSMTVDDDYVYISMWKKDSTTNRNKIMRVTRKYISSVKDRAVVEDAGKIGNSENHKYKVLLKSGEKVEFCRDFTVKYTDGSEYNKSITQIAKYSYDKENGITKFLITASKKNDNERYYAVATLKNNAITVEKGETFTLLNNLPNDSITAQDIFYDSKYGLYVLYWGYKNDTGKGSNVKNYVVRYNISSLKNKTKGVSISYQPSKIIGINGSSSKYDQYELESLAFINRDSSKNKMDKPAFIFSSNNVGAESDSTGSGRVDSIEKITYKSTDQGIVDLYANI